MLVSGCASWYPIEPKYDEQALIKAGARVPPQTLDVMGSAHLLAGWRMAMEEAAVDRQKGSIVASEILFYGTLLAFIGAGATFKYATEVRNVGATTVAGSTLFTSHYQQALQQVVFRKAADRLTCAERAIAPMAVAPASVLFEPTQAAALNEQLEAVPKQTRQFLDKQRSELQAALQQVTLQPLTREQWDDLITRTRAADTKATNSVVALLKEKNEVAVMDKRLAGNLAANDSSKREATAFSDEARAKRQKIAATDAELAEVRARYIAALAKYPTALEFCLANQQQ